ncbi:hypothetical protein EVAR_46676_1 [Eumeta japonica]|uniref:Uncharacterized protein n=1 Tax=Eumeta variegata TaxID=151549 RepID=A0A4C1Y1S0_EUMVA|nr:hypothetical protein EVAR_46676_1 [Eumeta japonica]
MGRRKNPLWAVHAPGHTGFDVFVESGRQHSDADGARLLWVLSDQHLGIGFRENFQFELKNLGIPEARIRSGLMTLYGRNVGR